jgi:hypothetical protein
MTIKSDPQISNFGVHSRLYNAINWVLYEDHQVNYANSDLQRLVVRAVIYLMISKLGYSHFLSNQFEFALLTQFDDIYT